MNHLASIVIARAREAWTNNPETDGGADAFDHHISRVGLERYGELYNEVYVLANENHRIRPGDDEAALDAQKDRADALWEQLLPELQAYVEDCRSATYTGWSSESSGPVRRVR